jgi:hypothetical protein
MDIQVIRKVFTDKSTIGDMYVDGNFECYTLEDATTPRSSGSRGIPAGSYEVVVSFSERFQRPLPLVINVPNFNSVRIHAETAGRDGNGCILVGKTKGRDLVEASKAVFEVLFDKIQNALNQSKIFIHITEQQRAS